MNNKPRQFLDAAYFSSKISVLILVGKVFVSHLSSADVLFCPLIRTILIYDFAKSPRSGNRVHPQFAPFLPEKLNKFRENRQDDSRIAFLFDKSRLEMYNISKKLSIRVQFVSRY